MTMMIFPFCLFSCPLKILYDLPPLPWGTFNKILRNMVSLYWWWRLRRLLEQLLPCSMQFWLLLYEGWMDAAAAAACFHSEMCVLSLRKWLYSLNDTTNSTLNGKSLATRITSIFFLFAALLFFRGKTVKTRERGNYWRKILKNDDKSSEKKSP